MDKPQQFDCVVVGSGFGGSVVARRVAQAGRSVLVLERGRKYPPGEFPRSPLETSINFWDPRKQLYGLFDIWSFKQFEAIVSSGLGGGSLIYANVLLRKPENWFVQTGQCGEYWPINYNELCYYYGIAEQELGMQVYPSARGHPYYHGKVKQFARAAAGSQMPWQPAPLAVTFSPGGSPLGVPIDQPSDNLHGVQRVTCRMCGQCDIGCNYGSKNTLDLTYLSRACEDHAVIKTLHEVKRITPCDGGSGGYLVDCVAYDPPVPRWQRDGKANRKSVQFLAKTLVLSAGTLGSTYLLLRNRTRLPNLSKTLGTRFSGNGDFLGFFTGDTRPMKAAEAPVITGYVLTPDALDNQGVGGRGYVIQDGGYPVLAEWLAEIAGVDIASRSSRVAGALVWARLSAKPRTQISSQLTKVIGDTHRASGMVPMLGFGRDLPHGVMRVRGKNLEIDWKMAYSMPVYRPIQQAMRTLADRLDIKYRPGPSVALSRAVTVHPLGGCPMGTSAKTGVVNSFGQVFGYPNLFVSDGSIMPGPVGTNPSLTIAAVAERLSPHVIVSAGRI